MTLVASFSINKHPIVLGDLMLSVEDDVADYLPFTTPLHVDPNLEVRDKQSRLVCGLTQKVNVLTPRLVVAWSGMMHEAENALPRIRDDVAGAGHTFSSLQQTLHGLSKLYKGLYLTGIMTLSELETNISVVKFSWPNETGIQFVSHMFGDCRIGGSGKEEFKQLIRTTEGLKMNVHGRTNQCTKTILEALMIAAKLSGDQMRCGNGLQDFYGGGFEIATLINGAVTKVGEIAYHLWDARLTTDAHVKITLHCILAYSYEGDLLLVRKIQPLKAPAPSTDELFVLSPVHKRLSEYEKAKLAEHVTPPSLDSTFAVFYLHIPQAPPDKRIQILMHYRGDTGLPPVQYCEFEDGIDLKLSPTLQQRVTTAAQRAISNKS